MEHTVFLCWQSDNPTARNAVQSALYKATKEVERKIGGQVAVDEDNRDYAGSPQIDHVIRERIRRASAMVADLSLVGEIIGPPDPNETRESAEQQISKKTPNPNVMFEVGYAFATIGPERVVLVRDKRLNGELPFDVNHHRYMEFETPVQLKDGLIEALLLILREPARLPGSESQRSIVLRYIAQGIPGKGLQRLELATELSILAENEDDVWFRLSEYLREAHVPLRHPSWRPYFGDSSAHRLTSDLRMMLNAATSADTRAEAANRVQEFLDSERISLRRHRMKVSLRPLSSGGASALNPKSVRQILDSVMGAEELGLTPAALREACEAFNETPAERNAVHRNLTEFNNQFGDLGDPLGPSDSRAREAQEHER